MKQLIIDKDNPNGKIVEVDNFQNEQPLETEVTAEERIEALEAAILELAGVILNG